VSSHYEIYCLSHDPATTHGDYRHPELAAYDIAEGLDGHEQCDLLIGRVSGGIVEIGCPPRGVSKKCCHSTIEWADTAWLRLLVHVHQDESDTARRLADAPALSCWSRERLHRLRNHLA
jgi:hypothetical protein